MSTYPSSKNIFNYHKNLIKKPGEWLILSIFNKYKTSNQFLKHLKGKLEANARANPELPRPLDEHLIKTVFGYYTKWLRVIPTKETLIKNLNLPAALKATNLTKTIENQSENELSERYQSQNDTGIKMTPVS